jgi:hypothetical protein
LERGAWRRRSCLLTALLCFDPEPAGALLIDAWSAEQTTTVISPAGSAASELAGAGIVGGEREILLTRSSGPAVTIAASTGSLAHGQIAGSLGTATVVWDGADVLGVLDPTGLGGVDFTDGATSAAISIPLLFGDLPASLILTAYTDAGNVSQAIVALPGSIPPDPPLVLIVPFGAFGVLSGVGADFANIGALSLLLDGSSASGLDLEIGELRTVAVPEPGAALLLGLGLAGLAGVRRSAKRG